MFLRRWPFLEGSGETAPMVDCLQGHHARTEPHVCEALRRVRIREDIDRELCRLRAEGLLPVVDVSAMSPGSPKNVLQVGPAPPFA